MFSWVPLLVFVVGAVSSGTQARSASAAAGLQVRVAGPSGADVLKEQLASVQASEAQVNGLLKSFQKGVRIPSLAPTVQQNLTDRIYLFR